jgi:WD40 repeat protein
MRVATRVSSFSLSLALIMVAVALSLPTQSSPAPLSPVLVPNRSPFEPEREDRLGQVRLFGEHTNFFTARFSPDGRLAVSGGGGELMLGTNQWIAGTDFDVRIWDVKTGAELHRLKHTEAVFAVFAPDSQLVLTTSGKTIRIWDARTGRLVCKHDGDVPLGWAAWSHDGKRWFIGCGDGRLRLFDAASGKSQRVFVGHTNSRIESVAFSSDDKRASSSGFDGTVRVWDVETGRQVLAVVANGGMRVRQAVWSPDGAFLLTGGADNLVHLWDVQKGREVRRFAGHSGYVESVSCSPSGRRMLSGSLDGTFRLWDIDTGKELHRFENFQLQNRNRTIVHIVFSPDGRYALSSGWDKTVRLWRLPD